MKSVDQYVRIYNDLHAITADMAGKWYTYAKTDLQRWRAMLKEIDKLIKIK
jgi:hypothetical protein